jgi:hypothetical protein
MSPAMLDRCWRWLPLIRSTRSTRTHITATGGTTPLEPCQAAGKRVSTVLESSAVSTRPGIPK